ncbi:thioredoxin domain-containing protein [Arthrobacter sp. zg-Y916]|uniref:thioredoxin domain-containing protein n=1 Tax=Arthrobacter sp. zg-Y916 TaxID=2894190 RepID=UPI001E435D37|nr:thioredoxin domain-containing protein [Arthrobacter sp. zg-Y916]MCC9194201.1 thioredoxin domain-containing protein [Arthrobacter sp. zg-Y916]
MAERLKNQASAYLRQHAGNPVDWWPFGDAAFNEARRRDVPVFISIGYAACHWCHVMAHESFEDPEIADFLNQHFVSIKVDREERPDVDSAYMAATQALTGQGGWPMSVFALPDGRTYYAGTYFPPQQLQGTPSFRQVLEAVSGAWRDRRQEVEQSAAQIAEHLASGQLANARLLGTIDGAGLPDAAEHAEAAARALSSAVEVLEGAEDTDFGGFGGAPKFPPSPLLRFLLAHSGSSAPTAAAAAGLAARTLTAMALGGLFDQVEGGFARYTVDRRWQVPHFEKMLYDNAQLLRLYAQWARSAEDPDHRALALRVTRETAHWLDLRLRLPGGAYASSLDADTQVDGRRVEGATYVFTRAELTAALGTGSPALDLLDVDADDGASHRLPGSTLRLAAVPDEAQAQTWEEARQILAGVRGSRPQPDRDEKVVAGWNGLAVAGLADAAAVLADNGVPEPQVLEAARDAAEYLLAVHRQDGILYRVSNHGSVQGIEGLLEDYAGVAEGLFALYAVTGEPRWHAEAQTLVAAAVDRFLASGKLSDTAAESAQVRHAQGGTSSASPLDDVVPSGTALFAGVLLTSASYGGPARHRALAEQLVFHVLRAAPAAPQAVGWAMSVQQALLDGPRELAVTGSDPDAVAALLAAGRAAGGPSLVIAHGRPDGVPLLEGRNTEVPALAYVCRGMACRQPVSTAEELRAQLRPDVPAG